MIWEGDPSKRNRKSFIYVTKQSNDQKYVKLSAFKLIFRQFIKW